MKRTLILAATACVLWSSGAFAEVNLITNGGFEDQRAATQPQRFFPGSNIGGWLVGGQGDAHVNLHLDSGQAYEGVQYVALSFSGGYISHVVNLNAGRDYTLQFYTFGQADRSLPPQSFQVNVVAEYPADTYHNSRVIANPTFPATYLCGCFADPARLPWLGFSSNFRADADVERLSFHYGTSDPSLFLLDAISVVEVPVPEPRSASLAGLVILGMAAAYARGTWRQ